MSLWFVRWLTAGLSAPAADPSAKTDESWNLLIDQRDDNCGCSNRCWSYLATGLHCAFDFLNLVIIEDDAQSALHDPARNSHSDGGHYQAVDERQEKPGGPPQPLQ